MKQREVELIKIAMLYELAPQEIKEQAWSILIMFGASASHPQEPDHKQEQTV
jgi:hypothetical protein